MRHQTSKFNPYDHAFAVAPSSLSAIRVLTHFLTALPVTPCTQVRTLAAVFVRSGSHVGGSQAGRGMRDCCLQRERDAHAFVITCEFSGSWARRDCTSATATRSVTDSLTPSRTWSRPAPCDAINGSIHLFVFIGQGVASELLCDLAALWEFQASWRKYHSAYSQ